VTPLEWELLRMSRPYLRLIAVENLSTAQTVKLARVSAETVIARVTAARLADQKAEIVRGFGLVPALGWPEFNTQDGIFFTLND
jgi:hypothetical protein